MKLFRILVVDDDQLIRKLIKDMITLTLGYEVLSASDGKKAIEVLSKLHVDLVITDNKMPFISGEELTRFVKLNYPGVRVILVSSNIEEVRKVAVAAGADLVMDKLKFIYVENMKFHIDKLLDIRNV